MDCFAGQGKGEGSEQQQGVEFQSHLFCCRGSILSGGSEPVTGYGFWKGLGAGFVRQWVFVSVGFAFCMPKVLLGDDLFVFLCVVGVLPLFFWKKSAGGRWGSGCFAEISLLVFSFNQ